MSHPLEFPFYTFKTAYVNVKYFLIILGVLGVKSSSLTVKISGFRSNFLNSRLKPFQNYHYLFSVPQ